MHRISEQKRGNHSIWNTFTAAASSHHVWMCNLTLRSILHEKQLGASEHTRNVPISPALVIIQAALRPMEKWKVHVLLQLWVLLLSAEIKPPLGHPVYLLQCFLALEELCTGFLETFKPSAAHFSLAPYLKSVGSHWLPSTVWGRLCYNSLCAEHRKGCWRKRALNHLCAPCVPLA